MQQEQHHVALGEELGHRRQLVGADLDAALVDSLLPLGLPELVGPAQRVARQENRPRQRLEQPLQLLPGLGRQGDGEGGVVAAEDAGQHPLREAPGHGPAILSPLAGQLLAIGQRDGDAFFGLDQQVVLGQEAGEQHAVPVLVGDLVGEALDLLHAGRRVEAVAELTPVRAEPPPQVLLVRRQRRVRPSIADGQHPQGAEGAGLAGPAGRLDCRRELVAKFAGQRLHLNLRRAGSPRASRSACRETGPWRADRHRR